MSEQSPKGREGRPAPIRPSTPDAKQVALKAKARSAAEAEVEDDKDDEEYETLMTTWLRQSPSWLVSTVVHMILFLVLFLIGVGGEVKDALTELEIGEPDVEETEELVEEDEEPLSEEVDPEIVSDSEEVVEEVISPEDFEVVTPEMMIDTQHDDTTLEATKIEFSDYATESAVSGDLLADLGGIASSGLGSRSTGGRAGAVRRGGGNAGSESAVEAALKWLEQHQNRYGSWSWNHTPGDRCSGFPNPGAKTTLMGSTGLALLPFLGAGYTHHKDNKYQSTVRSGLKYLVGNMQVANGAGRLYDVNGPSHEHMYSHGIAACAVAEAYGMSQDVKLKAPAQLSLNYIVRAQNPQSGGWLYTPSSASGDTSVVGWQIMALKSGVLSYLEVPPNVKGLSNRWLDSVQSDFYQDGVGVGSRYGYRSAKDRHGQSGATTAIGLLCRNYLGVKRDDPGMRKGVEWLASQGPSAADMYYNYYASMVMYQNDGPNGELWKKWNKVMRDQLINTQVKDGEQRGSWHFDGNHGTTGGRIYNTALACMTLEVYYRYMPVYRKDNVEKDDFPLE